MDANPAKEMPFLDHLEELRWRILWSLLAIFVASAVGVYAVLRLRVMDLLTLPLYRVIQDVSTENPDFLGLLGTTGRLTFLNLTEPFFFMLKLGITSGLVLASPFVAYHVWAFLAPALKPKEKRVIVPSLAFGLVLFAAGVALAYFIALPMTIRFLLLFGAEWFTPALTAGYYLSLVFGLLMAFGIVFELPVVITLLSALGLVTPTFLRQKRRHAIVGITILASVLSPGDYLQVTVLLMIPMVVLYELSVLLSAAVYRKRKSVESQDPPPRAIALLGVLAFRRWLQEA